MRLRKYDNTIRIIPWFYCKWRRRGAIVAPFVGDGPVGFMHAHKGGAPVLRGDASWRTVSGFYVNVRRVGFFTVSLRRHWGYGK